MIGNHAWQAQILDVIRYVSLLQHPSDLEEVTSRESANLLTINRHYSPAQIASLSLGCPGPWFGSDFGYETNAVQHQTNKQKQPVPPPPPRPPFPPNPSQPTTCTFLPSLTQLPAEFSDPLDSDALDPSLAPQTLFVRREHTDSFRGYNLFTSSMQQRHPRPSFMNCPYYALTGVLTGAWLRH